jgi:hypothetical protein
MLVNGKRSGYVLNWYIPSLLSKSFLKHQASHSEKPHIDSSDSDSPDWSPISHIIDG